MILTLFLLGHCADPGANIYDSDEARIIGNWTWIGTTGGFAGVNETPASTGQNNGAVFSDDGQVVWNYSARYSATNAYWLDMGMTIFSSDPMPVLVLDSIAQYHYKFRGADTLALAELVYDGYIYTYVRN